MIYPLSVMLPGGLSSVVAGTGIPDGLGALSSAAAEEGDALHCEQKGLCCRQCAR